MRIPLFCLVLHLCITTPEGGCAPLKQILPDEVLSVLREEYGGAMLHSFASKYHRDELIEVINNVLGNKYSDGRDADGNVDEHTIAQALTAIALLNGPGELLPSIAPYLKWHDRTVRERAADAYISVALKNNVSDEAAEALAPIVLKVNAKTEPIVRFWGRLDSPVALAVAIAKLRQLEDQLSQVGTWTDSEGRVQLQHPLITLIEHMHLLHNMKRPEAIEQWSQLMARLHSKYSGGSDWDRIVRGVVHHTSDNGTPWLPPEVKASLMSGQQRVMNSPDGAAESDKGDAGKRKGEVAPSADAMAGDHRERRSPDLIAIAGGATAILVCVLVWWRGRRKG